MLLPLDSVCETGAPLFTVNDTSPVGGPAAELTVTVTLPLVLYVIVGELIAVVVAAGLTCNVPVFELAPKLPCAE
jgi:hypothetical protein